MRRKVIAGNWKMNGSITSIQELIMGIEVGVESIIQTEIIVLPSFVYLQEVQSLLADSKINYGAQDISDAPSGAYTGEISGSMLNDFACKYVIVGHSERRNGQGESNELVAKKFKAAQEAGITPILCVGELLEQREAGETEEIVWAQIDAVLKNNEVDSLVNSIIAYEPVWAIGTGVTATPEQAQEVHAFIRSRLVNLNREVAENLIIQYGGSMNSGNAHQLLCMDDIDGGLIGGASLNAEDFLSICRVAENLS